MARLPPKRVLWNVMEGCSSRAVISAERLTGFWLMSFLRNRNYPRLRKKQQAQHVIRPERKNHDEVLAASRRCPSLIRRRPLLLCARCLGILPHSVCWYITPAQGATVISPLGKAGIVQSAVDVW